MKKQQIHTHSQTFAFIIFISRKKDLTLILTHLQDEDKTPDATPTPTAERCELQISEATDDTRSRPDSEAADKTRSRPDFLSNLTSKLAKTTPGTLGKLHNQLVNKLNFLVRFVKNNRIKIRYYADLKTISYVFIRVLIK